MTGKNIYDWAVSKPRAIVVSGDANRLAELAALVEMRLGHSLDAPTFQALAVIQVELWKTQEGLEAMLQRGVLHPENCWEGLNSAIELSIQRSLGVLGDERFDAIFGEAGRHPRDLVDRDIFLAHIHPR